MLAGWLDGVGFFGGRLLLLLLRLLLGERIMSMMIIIIVGHDDDWEAAVTPIGCAGVILGFGVEVGGAVAGAAPAGGGLMMIVTISIVDGQVADAGSEAGVR